jgi:6-pyruvoyltetrahydropterin/6-carboxytetrahydropterin synthase
MFMISREYWFSSAHRLEGHPKCGRLHGHNYKLVVHVQSVNIDDGMIMDYARLDSIVKPIVDELDHRYIISYSNLKADCPYAAAAMVMGHHVALDVEHSTAEEMSRWFYNEICQSFELLGLTFIVWVELWETPKSQAVFTG